MTLDFLLLAALLVLFGLWLYFFRLWRDLLVLEQGLVNQGGDWGGIMKEKKVRGGIVTVCSFCNRVKGREGDWTREGVSTKVQEDMRLSHGLCPDCARSNWPEFFPEEVNGAKNS